MDPLARRLDAACRIARDAGRLALRHFENRGGLAVEAKGRQDLVSEADRAVEALIRRELAARFPEDGVLGEEEGGEETSLMWIVDPIDGTSNFLRGVPYWGVVLAYAVGGTTEIGVTYDPVHDEMFAARRGAGAWRDGVPIQVSERPLEASSCALSFSFKNDARKYEALIGRLADAGIDHRRTGSTALNLCHVADGRHEAMLTLGCNSWDAAAGLCLVEAAGGIASAWPLGEWTRMRAVAACAPGVEGALAEVAGFGVREGAAG
ncbi:MAG: inositol monophosphatase [Geminicoccaceae bacterium]|nr:inositol monophosphatase [Geminicoccaceae bacterium]